MKDEDPPISEKNIQSSQEAELFKRQAKRWNIFDTVLLAPLGIAYAIFLLGTVISLRGWFLIGAGFHGIIISGFLLEYNRRRLVRHVSGINKEIWKKLGSPVVQYSRSLPSITSLNRYKYSGLIWTEEFNKEKSNDATLKRYCLWERRSIYAMVASLIICVAACAVWLIRLNW